MGSDKTAYEKRGVDARAKFKSSKFSDVKFINRELTRDEKEDLKAHEFSDSDAWLAMDKYCEEYKFTLRYDERGACYSCFMQPTGVEHINTGLILTGRGSSLVKALKQTLYKHERLAFEQDWGTLDGTAHADIDD